MTPRAVLCPVDFSESSRVALGHAAVIADHFGARLIALAVDEPFLVDAAAMAGFAALQDETRRELQRVCHAVLGDRRPGQDVEFRVRAGKPAVEILREAERADAGLIVMSSRGQTGVRKMFFGSTTEGVLRETTRPVLVTAGDRLAGSTLAALAHDINRVLVPVDLGEHSRGQLEVAADVARLLSVPLLVVHVVEPAALPFRIRMSLAGVDADRRTRAEEAMRDMASIAAGVSTETLIIGGEPADEIVKLSEARHAGLIVMALHSSEPRGPRMGTVTYRVLCLTHRLVLALPPKPATSEALSETRAVRVRGRASGHPETVR